MNRWTKFKYWWMRTFTIRLINIRFEGNPYSAGDVIIDGTGKSYLFLGKDKMKLIKKKGKKLTRSEFIANHIKLPNKNKGL